MIVEHFMRERPHPKRWRASISTGAGFALLTPAAGAAVEILRCAQDDTKKESSKNLEYGPSPDARRRASASP